MGLSRAALNTAVTAELAPVLTLAGFASTDTSGAMKEPLDQTFRALGVAEADLPGAAVADGGEAQALAYLAYFTTAKAYAALTSKMDVSSSGDAAKLNQRWTNVRELMLRRLAIAQGYGLPIAGDGASGIYPIPFAGGISAGGYAAEAQDADRLPPLFTLSDLVVVAPSPWGDR